MKMVTFEKSNSVGHSNDIVLNYHMSNGEVYSAWFDNGSFYVVLKIDSDGNDRLFGGGITSFDVHTSDISVVQDAIWCVANGWLDYPESFRGFSKNIITRALNKNQSVWDAIKVISKENK
jgi:hypothetical protein